MDLDRPARVAGRAAGRSPARRTAAAGRGSPGPVAVHRGGTGSHPRSSSRYCSRKPCVSCPTSRPSFSAPSPGCAVGSLAGLRRTDINAERLEISFAAAADRSGRLKATKTRQRRTVPIDAATAEMLARHLQETNDRAAELGLTVAEDAFVFSEAPDCSKPCAPDRTTKRTRPSRCTAPPRPKPQRGQPDRSPAGGGSDKEIGEELGRSPKWVMLAIRRSAGSRQPPAAPSWTSTARSSRCASSRPANSSPPASTSRWSPSARVTRPACSSRTAPAPDAPHIGGPPNTSVGLCTGSRPVPHPTLRVVPSKGNGTRQSACTPDIERAFRTHRSEARDVPQIRSTWGNTKPVMISDDGCFALALLEQCRKVRCDQRMGPRR